MIAHDQPLSIIVPLHNDGETIGAVLDSLAEQKTGRAFEVIVVDDGSTDKGAFIAQARGICVIRQQNRGASAARNRGAQRACGKVLLFHDADCIASGNWIESLAEKIKPGVCDAAVGTAVVIKDDAILQNPQTGSVEGAHTVPCQNNEPIPIASPAFAITAALFAELGGFDEDLTRGAYLDLARRVCESGRRIALAESAVVSLSAKRTGGEF